MLQSKLMGGLLFYVVNDVLRYTHFKITISFFSFFKHDLKIIFLLLQANLHDYSNFEELLGEWNTTQWLRARPWHIQEVLPPQKEFGIEVDDDYLTNLMVSTILYHLYMYKCIIRVNRNTDAVLYIFRGDNCIHVIHYQS